MGYGIKTKKIEVQFSIIAKDINPTILYLQLTLTNLQLTRCPPSLSAQLLPTPPASR